MSVHDSVRGRCGPLAVLVWTVTGSAHPDPYRSGPRSHARHSGNTPSLYATISWKTAGTSSAAPGGAPRRSA